MLLQHSKKGYGLGNMWTLFTYPIKHLNWSEGGMVRFKTRHYNMHLESFCPGRVLCSPYGYHTRERLCPLWPDIPKPWKQKNVLNQLEPAGTQFWATNHLGVCWVSGLLWGTNWWIEGDLLFPPQVFSCYVWGRCIRHSTRIWCGKCVMMCFPKRDHAMKSPEQRPM